MRLHVPTPQVQEERSRRFLIPADRQIAFESTYSFFLLLRHDGAPRRDTASRRQIVVTVYIYIYVYQELLYLACSIIANLCQLDPPIVPACNSFFRTQFEVKVKRQLNDEMKA